MTYQPTVAGWEALRLIANEPNGIASAHTVRKTFKIKGQTLRTLERRGLLIEIPGDAMLMWHLTIAGRVLLYGKD